MKINIISFVVCLLLITLFPTSSFADQHDTTDYWDKGRYHTYYVDGQSMGTSVGIISVGAYYDPTSQMGVNRIRVWSRTPAVKAYYNSYFGVAGTAWVSNVFITNENVDPIDNIYNIYNWDPQDWNWGTEFVDKIFYDIISYYGIPDNTVAAVVNYLTTYIKVTGNTYSKTIEFRNPDYARDLPSGVYYNDADKAVNAQLSSYQAKFWYDLNRNTTRFNMAARGKINYSYKFWDAYMGSYQTYLLPTSQFSHGYEVNYR